jgi:hypothetical protein
MLSALETVSDYLTDARVLLQDVIPPYRYDDWSLLTALNVTLLEARRFRADLFVYNRDCGRYSGQVPFYNAVDAERVPLEQSFRLPMVYGLVGHALARDQDDYQDSRASSFLNLFNVALVGTVPSPPAVIAGGGQ